MKDFFKRVYNAIKNEPIKTVTANTIQFRTQSRMWFKLMHLPSKAEAIFLQKMGEMGTEMSKEARRKYQEQKKKEASQLATIPYSKLTWGHAFEQAVCGINLHRKTYEARS